MSTVALAFVASAVAGLFSWPLLRPVIDRPRWRRTNYRGITLVGIGGVAVVAVGSAALLVLSAVDVDGLESRHGRATLLAIVGFGVLGFLDDASTGASGGGFAGHLRALFAERRVTTGLVKLVGGAALAMVVVATADPSPPDASATATAIRLLRGGAVVALGANLLNLFDRAPARATKVGVLWLVALLAGLGLWGAEGATLWVAWAACVIGTANGLAPTEVRERHMQGDAGVNAMGAAVGLATVITCPASTQWIVLGVLLVLNLASERVSFTSVIDQTPPLRWLDRFGCPYRS
ncbi:MAG: hypothetical protein P8N02_05540 [Actinomycetota bacterium]|nr:hypothetical protein [Actinomycetota bacterium]